jgi:hypothetical protein
LEDLAVMFATLPRELLQRLQLDGNFVFISK